MISNYSAAKQNPLLFCYYRVCFHAEELELCTCNYSSNSYSQGASYSSITSCDI